jgi:hypothetical protein
MELLTLKRQRDSHAWDGHYPGLDDASVSNTDANIAGMTGITCRVQCDGAVMVLWWCCGGAVMVL